MDLEPAFCLSVLLNYLPLTNISKLVEWTCVFEFCSWRSLIDVTSRLLMSGRHEHVMPSLCVCTVVAEKGWADACCCSYVNAAETFRFDYTWSWTVGLDTLEHESFKEPHTHTHTHTCSGKYLETGGEVEEGWRRWRWGLHTGARLI